MRKGMSKSFGKFLILCAGGFVASVGSGISSFGLSAYVFQQTGLASSTTLVALLAFVPGLLLSPLAGILADRFDRRLLMILGDGLSALGLVYILLCMAGGEAQLWQIGVGVTISSVFSSLIEPAFRATITDLVSEEEYTKASGFVQLSSSAKFLISPLIAGPLLAFSGIRVLLLIDICTIILTVIATVVVKRGIVTKHREEGEAGAGGFRAGWAALTKNRGVFVLTLMGAVITFFIAFIQTLSTPLILSFADSTTLGVSTTICATGMLVSSLVLGMLPMKGNHAKILSLALFVGGICMAGFGFRESIPVICIFGFLFFATLPFANTSIDYLIRTNVDNAVQGRVWGLIGILSQMGYVVAYVILGPLADYVFAPLLMEGGALAGSLGQVMGVGPGRGIGLLIGIAGLLLAVTAVLLYRMKSVRELERGGAACTAN